MRPETDTLLIGESAAIQALRNEVRRVAPHDVNLLLTGECGTGKELLAGEIHRRSARAARPFVPVNCAGIPETLLESELFGCVRGSVTGASRDRPGKLEAANQGTIFLDEIAVMTPRMQGLLLRFLETGEVQKVGADRLDTRANVRVIGTSNQDLRRLMAQGQFREDLYYRINVVRLELPPLRERRDDIPLLVEHFLERFTMGAPMPATSAHGVDRDHAPGTDVRGRGDAWKPSSSVALAVATRRNDGPLRSNDVTIPPEVIAVLTHYQWPGNVRELRNVVERLVVAARDREVRVEDLPIHIRLAGSVPQLFKERRRTIVDELYRRLVSDGESFWRAVYPLFMQREISRATLREIVRRGLEHSRGNYRIVAEMFNIAPSDYKRFLNFLRQHDCQLPFREFR